MSDHCTPTALAIRPYQLSDESATIALWDQCNLLRPCNNPHRDIQRKLSFQPDLFLLAILGGQVVGSVMAGYEGHRGWINYLAVAPQHRRQGIARRLMAEAERRLLALGCPKINLQVRSTNHAVLGFYSRIGYAQDEVISLGKRLLSDETTPR